MSFFDTFLQMLVILFAVAMGYGAHHLGYLGEGVNQKLSKLIIHVTVPALTLAAAINNDSGLGWAELKGVLLTIAAFYGLSLAMAFVLPRLIGGTEKQRGVWSFSVIFSNAIYIGYPVVQGLLGEEGLFYAVIVVLPMTLLNYTIGPLVLGGKARFSWRQVVTPGTICALLALFITFTGVRPPRLLGEMLGMVGSITTPLSLLVLGSMLTKMPMRSAFASWRLWALSAARLLVLPALLALVLRLLGTDPLLMSAAVILIGMPVAVNGSMMCLEFGGDADVMARGIFLSTVLCIVTIPLATALFL